MRRFVNILTLILFAALPMGSVVAKKKPAEEEPKIAKATPAPKLDIPIPIGHDAQGVVFPSYDSSGKLRMMFTIQFGLRSDVNHLQMSRVKVETYDEKGKKDMTINLTKSVLDLNTYVVFSDEPVHVQNSDFELTGEKMRFNADTRQGTFTGHVKMLIYNRASMTSQEPTQ